MKLKLFLATLFIIFTYNFLFFYFYYFTNYNFLISLNSEIIFMLGLPVNLSIPNPIKIFNQLNEPDKLLEYKKEEYGLKNKSGIYAFINKVNGKRYIGSAKDLYRRMRDHLYPNSHSSNIALQQAFSKYGKENFEFAIYAYVEYRLPHILDIESLFMSHFTFSMLYNIRPVFIPNLDKLKQRIKENKNTHLITKGFLGRKHTLESKLKMAKFKDLNSMFGKTHSEHTREKISLKLGTPTYLYDENKKYVLTFKNNVTLAKFLNCYKGTVGRYIKSGKLFKANQGNFYISKIYNDI